MDVRKDRKANKVLFLLKNGVDRLDALQSYTSCTGVKMFDSFLILHFFAYVSASWSMRVNEAVLHRTRLCLQDSITQVEQPLHFNVQPRKRAAQVVDASLLFNEIELLEIRLYELRDIVDYFLVIEQNETHTGKPKELVFDYERLVRNLGPHVMRKVIYKNCAYPPELHIERVVLGRSPQQAVHWLRENYPRETCTRDLLLDLKKRLLPDALFLQSDIDEIPDALAVASFKYCQYTKPTAEEPRLVAFRQARYHFNFHCASSNMYHWTGTMMTSVTYALEIGLQKLRDLRPTTADCRVSIGWGGWHFSNSPFGDAQKLVEKYTAFAESQTIDHVRQEDLLAYWTHAMTNGGDVRSNTQCEERELRHLPRLVQDMPLRYKHLLNDAQLERLID
jgi:hypothetical protein